MSNDVVRYNNGLNSVPLRQFTPIEMDIFWSICSKMKRQGTNPCVFKFEVFKELANYDRRGKDNFYLALVSTWDKLKRLSFIYEDEHIYRDILLFQEFEINKDLEHVTIQTSSKFEFILNTIATEFTRFELENMVQLSSSYSKELYRQLMAHRDRKTKQGAWFVTISDFRILLNIPNSYRMCDIDKQIFDQAKKDFLMKKGDSQPIFSSFEIEKIRARKGNKINSLKIYFSESSVLDKLRETN